jgi:hypothetical protein
MTELREGDAVRVRPDLLPRFTVSVANKVRDRSGVVEGFFIPLGSRMKYARVRFGKRNGRGKEFVDVWRADDLERVTE